MEYVCDAPGDKTWFRIETENEAALEAIATTGKVAFIFDVEHKAACQSYRPHDRLRPIERDICLGAHLRRFMPQFLTLRDREGAALATALLPPRGLEEEYCYLPSVFGPEGSDPYAAQADAIRALEKHFDLEICKPVSKAPISLENDFYPAVVF